MKIFSEVFLLGYPALSILFSFNILLVDMVDNMDKELSDTEKDSVAVLLDMDMVYK